MPTLQLLQSYLDEIGHAVMRGDWETYLNAVCLPFHFITESTSLVVASEADLRAGFDEFHQMLTLQRVTDYIRLAESAVDIDDLLISGRYVSHMITSGGHRLMPPFRSQITLRLVGNTWRAAAITNSLTNMRWPILIPAVATADAPFKGDRDV